LNARFWSAGSHLSVMIKSFNLKYLVVPLLNKVHPRIKSWINCIIYGESLNNVQNCFNCISYIMNEVIIYRVHYRFLYPAPFTNFFQFEYWFVKALRDLGS
jgi:hypothetical protein